MMRIGLIGIGAGAAAALLFASVASGTLLSIPLFYLAPLPILIAALGWSHWAALLAAAAAAIGLAAVFGAVFFFAFLAGAGVPALVARLSHHAGAAGDGRCAPPGSTGIRPAVWWSGPPFSPRSR